MSNRNVRTVGWRPHKPQYLPALTLAAMTSTKRR
ncbi:unnamed protein product [Oppiella nova]|uniref:Uncharacterized protein n=1 Tax=Oppiella nova TaxID=334625 RepID=A0A7R9QYV7_9ACAR|nr:unnamed protein product [Oppiella nova]CAG2180010.1 unnamed protein product [Oppiella nova]